MTRRRRAIQKWRWQRHVEAFAAWFVMADALERQAAESPEREEALYAEYVALEERVLTPIVGAARRDFSPSDVSVIRAHAADLAQIQLAS